MKFDDFYESVGVFGRYQKLKYFLVCLTYMLPPILVYTWTFTAATPSFSCQVAPNKMSEMQISDEILLRYRPTENQCRKYKNQLSIQECQRCYHTKNRTLFSDENDEQILKPCQHFLFNRTYYQSTLVEEWSMVCDGVSLKSFVQMIFFFGYMVGSLVFGILSDKYGRKPIMGVSFLIITLASLLCAFAPQEQLGFQLSYTLYTLGRFLLACATRGIALTGFVIGVEIVGAKQRLFSGVVLSYFFGLGELILLLLAYFIRNWRILHIALLILSVPFLFFYFILPESPRWLISVGQYDRAETILRQIAKTNQKTFDENLYERFVAEEKKRETLVPEKKHGFMAIFRSKVMLFIAINMSFQWFVQNLVFYGVSQNTGSWLKNPYVSFGAGAFVELLAYSFVHFVLHRWSRKTSYSSFVIGFVIVALLVVPIQTLMIKNSRGQYILMFIVNIALKFFASGSYTVIYIYANELFPTEVRNTGIGICSMVSRVGAIFGTLFNDLLARVWLYFPIVAFGLTSLIAVALVTLCPETSHKSLPQSINDVERTGLASLLCRSKALTRVETDPIQAVEEFKSLKQQSNVQNA